MDEKSQNNYTLSDERKHAVRQEKNYYIPILKILKDHGGEVSSYDELTELLPEYTDFTSDELNYSEVTDKGNVNHYHWFGRNLATRDLQIAGLVEHDRGKDIKLTSKGQNIDIDKLDIERDILDIIRPIKNKENQRRKMEKVKAQSSKDGLMISDSDLDSSNTSVYADDTWKEIILDRVYGLSPKEFESFCRGLLRKMGFELDTIKGIAYSGDFGIDGFGYLLDSGSLRTTRVCIQCKSYNSNHAVSVDEINSLRGAIDTNRSDYGIMMTTSYFSDQAIKAARSGSSNITLINGQELTELMSKYEYKVYPATVYRVDESYFDSAESRE